MSLDEFLEAFRRQVRPGEFVLKGIGCIRTPPEDRIDTGFCPICWLATKLGKNSTGSKTIGFTQVGKRLGLSYDDCQIIASSADNSRNETFRAEVRAKLLAACGLTEGL